MSHPGAVRTPTLFPLSDPTLCPRGPASPTRSGTIHHSLTNDSSSISSRSEREQVVEVGGGTCRTSPTEEEEGWALQEGTEPITLMSEGEGTICGGHRWTGLGVEGGEKGCTILSGTRVAVVEVVVSDMARPLKVEGSPEVMVQREITLECLGVGVEADTPEGYMTGETTTSVQAGGRGFMGTTLVTPPPPTTREAITLTTSTTPTTLSRHRAGRLHGNRTLPCHVRTQCLNRATPPLAPHLHSSKQNCVSMLLKKKNVDTILVIGNGVGLCLLSLLQTQTRLDMRHKSCDQAAFYSTFTSSLVRLKKGPRNLQLLCATNAIWHTSNRLCCWHLRVCSGK